MKVSTFYNVTLAFQLRPLSLGISQTWTTSIAGDATTLNITEAEQKVRWPLELDSCTAVGADIYVSIYHSS